MSDISILDLQNLRHLIGGYETTHCKMTDYANQAQDAEIKKLFQDAAVSAMKNKEGGSRMNEKTMVSDALVGVNGELKMFGEMIPQTENKELKQCLKQIRSECEMSQEKLYQVAREKSYYVPAAKATREEIDHVKNILTQPSMK